MSKKEKKKKSAQNYFVLKYIIKHYKANEFYFYKM